MNDKNTGITTTLEWCVCFGVLISSLLCLKNGIINGNDIRITGSVIITCVIIIYLVRISIKMFVSMIILNIDIRIMALMKLANKHANITVLPAEYHRFVSETINSSKEKNDD